MTQAFIALNKAVETLTDLVGDHEGAWRLMGQCGTSDPDLAYDGDQDREVEGNPVARRLMKRMCGECPVREKCLDHAMVNQEPAGIWGGMTTREREEHKSAWEKRHKTDLEALKRTYRLSRNSRAECYETRLVRARQAREAVLVAMRESDEDWSEHLEVLDLLLANPFTSCAVLAVRMGWGSRQRFERRFKESCELAGVL